MDRNGEGGAEGRVRGRPRAPVALGDEVRSEHSISTRFWLSMLFVSQLVRADIKGENVTEPCA